MGPRFGTDGIRGVAGTELTAELALALGRAAARHVEGDAFLIGRDTRRSGPMLQAALAAGLAAEGVDVVDVGVIPTPGLALLAARRRTPAAMVSASHNPYTDNGIKLFDRRGVKLDPALEGRVQHELDRLLAAPAAAAGGGAIGSIALDPGAVGEYADSLVASVADFAAAGMEVVVDAANGAASAVGPAVLERLGVRLRALSSAPDGTNINAGCGSTDLSALTAAVVEHGAAVGIAFDGDADRMLAVDHTGAVVDGDQLLVMFAVDLAARGRLTGGAVAVTVMSNLGLKLALGEAGIGVVVTPVGDRNVTDAMAEHGLALGGEQSGHFVFADHATTGDGLLTAVLLLDLLARSGRSLAELAKASMTALPQVLVNVKVARPDRLGDARAVWDEVEAVATELGESGRVLLRASGTEPIVRVMVEAPTKAAADAAAERLVRAVEAGLGTGAVA